MRTDTRSRALRHTIPHGIPVALAALYALGMVNFWVPALRFTSPLANAFAFAALQLVPLGLMILAVETGPRWLRVLFAIIILPFAAFAGLLGSCAAMNGTAILARGTDPSFEPLGVVPLSTGHLAIHRTNGGAMTSYGISVRHQCRLLPGLLRVRRVWGAYPAYEVQTQVLAADRVRFSSPAYLDRRPEVVDEITLKPLSCPAAR